MFDLAIVMWQALIVVFIVAAFLTFLTFLFRGNSRADEIARRADVMGEVYRNRRAENIRRYGRDSRGMK